MTSELLQRQAALAGVALLATVGALALGREGPAESFPTTEVTAPAQWQEAVVGVFRGPYDRPTSCGIVLTRRLRGVVHPVLPCGAKLMVSTGGREVRIAVVEQGGASQGHEFDLTAGLARALGIRDSTRIRWRFAAAAR